jgi:hypothetical protein
MAGQGIKPRIYWYLSLIPFSVPLSHSSSLQVDLGTTLICYYILIFKYRTSRKIIFRTNGLAYSEKKVLNIDARMAENRQSTPVRKDTTVADVKNVANRSSVGRKNVENVDTDVIDDAG